MYACAYVYVQFKLSRHVKLSSAFQQYLVELGGWLWQMGGRWVDGDLFQIHPR